VLENMGSFAKKLRLFCFSLASEGYYDDDFWPLFTQ